MKPPILPVVNQKLSHLSRDQRVELYSQYYVKSNTEIIEKYNLTIKSNIHKVFEPKILDEVCTFCETPLWGYYPPKISHSDYTCKECPNCNHTLYESSSYRCTCQTCENSRNEERRIKREKELNDLLQYRNYIVNQNGFEIDFETLTFTDRLYLLAYMYSQSKYNCPIPELSGMRIFVQLSPTYEFSREIIKHLTDRRILKFNENTDLEYIRNYIVRGDITRLMQIQAFEININEFSKYENKLLQLIKTDTQKYQEVILEIVRKIAIYKCFDYYKHQLQLIKCPYDESMAFNYDEFFSKQLNHFSVSQIQKVIDSCTGSCAKDYLSGYRYKKQMPKLLERRIENYTKKALFENWKLNNQIEYNETKSSIICFLLFECILNTNTNWVENKIDNRFIEECLNEIHT